MKIAGLLTVLLGTCAAAAAMQKNTSDRPSHVIAEN
jgi:hypothetical protein